jgi:hypothetical protein
MKNIVKGFPQVSKFPLQPSLYFNPLYFLITKYFVKIALLLDIQKIDNKNNNFKMIVFECIFYNITFISYYINLSFEIV